MWLREKHNLDTSGQSTHDISQYMFFQSSSDGLIILGILYRLYRLMALSIQLFLLFLPFRAAAKDTEEEYDSGIEEENWTRQADAAKN